MEADWEVEIGPAAPMVDACWAGYVDLRASPERIAEISEARNFPPLSDALLHLNGSSSPVWTAKCDLWPLDLSAEGAKGFDPDEMDAPPERAGFAWGCYIDLLPTIPGLWTDATSAVSWCKTVCGQLHDLTQSCCRVDFTVRSAMIESDSLDIGITAYTTCCDATSDEALAGLGIALGKLADVLRSHSTVE